MALTTEQIFSACDQLWQDGTVPAPTAVRRILGKGSFSTIGKAIREWKESHQPSEITEETAIDLDPDTMSVIKRLVGTIAGKLSDREQTEQIKLLEEENNNYQELNGVLTRENDELKGYQAAYDVLRKDFEKIIRENENLRKGIAPDNAELIEALTQERDCLQEQTNNIHKEQLYWQDLYDEKEIELKAEKQLLAEIKQERDESQADLRQIRAESSNLIARLEAEQERVSTFQNSLEKKSQRILQLENELRENPSFDMNKYCHVSQYLKAQKKNEELEEVIEKLKTEIFVMNLPKQNQTTQDNDLVPESQEFIEELEESESIVKVIPEIEQVTEIEANSQPIMIATKQELAARFGCKQNTFNRHLNSGKFSEWSKGKDPEGLTWEKQGKNYITFG